MKRLVFVTLCVSVFLCGCKTPQEIVVCPCEDVTKPSDMPWIEELIKTTAESGEPVEYVEKVLYAFSGSDEEYVGFLVEWPEPRVADAVMGVLLDCDGNWLATYRLNDCEGLCQVYVTSRLRIYEKEKSPQEYCEWAIRGEWRLTNTEEREESLYFSRISPTGWEGLLSHYVAPINHDGVQEEGYINHMIYSVTPDSLTIKKSSKAQELLFKYTTHYSITNDTLLTIDRFSEDGSSFRKIELSLVRRY